LLYTITGIPYFQMSDKLDLVKLIAKEGDIVDLDMVINMTLEPMRTDKKVEGTLKFTPVGVWEGTGQQVEVEFSKE